MAIGVALVDNLFFIPPVWEFNAPSPAELFGVLLAGWIIIRTKRYVSDGVVMQRVEMPDVPEELRAFGRQLAERFENPHMREKVQAVLAGERVDN